MGAGQKRRIIIIINYIFPKRKKTHQMGRKPEEKLELCVAGG